MQGSLVYEGKAKKIFSTSDDSLFLMEFKDSLTAFNALKKGDFKGKGELNCQISTLIFEKLTQVGIKHHWVETSDRNKMLVKKTKIIPIEVVIRNVIAGSLAKKLNIEEGTALKSPILEFYFKDDALGDPFVNDEQVLAFGWATQPQITQIKEMAYKINEVLKTWFGQKKMLLVDFKTEFGLDKDQNLILADEISPDCMRLWDSETGQKMDKDRFRRDLGDIDKAYLEVFNRLKGEG